MKSIVLSSAAMLAVAAIIVGTDLANARGRGGFRGGGGRSFGGGGRSFGGGGRSFGGGNRNFNRPSHSPSFSAPRRPSGGSGVRPGSRPGGNRQPGNFTRPTTRPGVQPGGNRPNVKQPGGNRPGIKRPGGGTRPGTLPEKRPGTGNRPGSFPGIGNRPPVQLPGLGGGNRPGAGDRLGNRGDRVGQRHDNIQNRTQNRGQYRQQRSDNLQSRLDSRFDRQGQRQGNLADRQQNRRNDFQNWNNDYYRHHYSWYHGGWHGGYYGGWGNRWNYMWNRYPGLMAFNTTIWGLNRIGYWWGYRPYSNVYYTGGTTIVNYNQPVLAQPPYQAPANGTTQQPPTSGGQEPLPPGVSQKGMAAFQQAQEEFKAGNYSEALTSVDAALKEMPRDAVVNEFRALVLFAQGDYKHAAETLYAVLSVGPGWDWTTLSGLYGNVEDYTKQLRALEKHVDANPNDAAAHFVLGYQYVTCGHKEAAGKQFQAALRLNPNDVVSKQMLDTLGVTPVPESTPPAAGTKKPPTVPLDSLVGNWKATRGNSAFGLSLSKDKSFTWTYTEGTKKTVVKGVFAVDGDEIAMEPDAGGVMLAQIKLQGASTLLFKMVGDEKDPALTFKK